MLNIVGYDKLNDGQDGLRFAWSDGENTPYVESAAFINKTKDVDGNICGYTTSVSKGCILGNAGLACKFCRTGNCLPYRGLLSDIDIAKQNVFMVLNDLYCDEHPEIKNKKREFAYMGQGEPGFSYKQVRRAIEITNSVMRELHQNVYRHIFATCGVPFAIKEYTNDVKHYFSERVTLHFSLHATLYRDLLMPINRIFPYQESLDELFKSYDITKDKPCIGIMLFNSFRPNGSDFIYTNAREEILTVLRELNPEKCRLSFCEFNPSSDVGESSIYDYSKAKELLEIANEFGFEAKLFSSFGQKEQTACGMLGGKKPSFYASNRWIELNAIADELVNYHSKNI